MSDRTAAPSLSDRVASLETRVTAIENQTPPPPPPTPESPDGTMITTDAGNITDSAGHKIALVATAGRGLQVTVDGAPDAATQNVTSLLYLNHLTYRQNADQTWASRNGDGTWTAIAGDPRVPQPPNADLFTVDTPKTTDTVKGTVRITGKAGSQWVNVAAWNNASGAKVTADAAPANGTYTLTLDTAQIGDGPANLVVRAFTVPPGQSGGAVAEIGLQPTVQNATTTPPTPTPTTNLPGDSTGVQAFRIADMLDQKLGFNCFPTDNPATNMYGTLPSDYSANSVIAALKYMFPDGCGHRPLLRVYYYNGRRAMVEAWCNAVCAATGARVTLCIGANAGAETVPEMAAMAKASSTGSGWMYAMEGINEPNMDFGNGTQSPAATVAAQRAVWQACQATAGDRYPVIATGPSIVFGLPGPEGWIMPPDGYLKNQADLDAIRAASTYGNVHVYPPNEGSISDGMGRGGSLADVFVGFSKAFPGKRLSVTEWHPSLYDMQNTGNRLNANMDAFRTLTCIFEMHRLGYGDWHWYALFDYQNVYFSGAFPRNGYGNPRPAANTIRAFHSLTPDTGADRHTFQPGKLNYTVSGLPAPLGADSPYTGGQHRLYQASGGAYYLTLWNIGRPSANVTVNFNRTMRSVRLYKPSDPVAPNKLLADQSIGQITFPLEQDTARLLQLIY